jgi:hypothetical protein
MVTPTLPRKFDYSLAVVPSVAWDFLLDKHINLTYLAYLSCFSLHLIQKKNV